MPRADSPQGRSPPSAGTVLTPTPSECLEREPHSGPGARGSVRYGHLEPRWPHPLRVRQPAAASAPGKPEALQKREPAGGHVRAHSRAPCRVEKHLTPLLESAPAPVLPSKDSGGHDCRQLRDSYPGSRPHSAAPGPKGVWRSVTPILESYRPSCPPTATVTTTSTPTSPVTLGLPAPVPGPPATPFIATPTSRRGRCTKRPAPRILTTWTLTSSLLTAGKQAQGDQATAQELGAVLFTPALCCHIRYGDGFQTAFVIASRGQGERAGLSQTRTLQPRVCEGRRPSAAPRAPHSPADTGGPGRPPRTNRTHSGTRLARGVSDGSDAATSRPTGQPAAHALATPTHVPPSNLSSPPQPPGRPAWSSSPLHR